MKFGVVVFPGSNCDFDTYHVLKDVFKQDTVFLWHKDHDLRGVDCVFLPGGFSYGDYLRPGVIARFSPLMQEIGEFALKGGLVIGICNGFQILQELQLLPGAMLRNRSLKFICRHVPIKITNAATPFTHKGYQGQVLKIPVAHYDGNFFADKKTMEAIKNNRQIVFQYSESDGRITENANINGSLENIAGIANKSVNVLGMMPHPERASEALLGSEDGKIILESLIQTWKKG